jgi:hypothetical protein
MSQLQIAFRSARVRASVISMLSLIAVVMAGGAGSKWG